MPLVKDKAASSSTDSSHESMSLVARPEAKVRSRSVAQVIVKACEVKAGRTTTWLTTKKARTTHAVI